jgi:hypothetical protein
MIEKLRDVLFAVRDLVAYTDSLADARSRAVVIYAKLDALQESIDAPPKAQELRYALRLPPVQMWDDEHQVYVNAPERTIFFIDGFITDSKIMAIKQVRANTGMSLKDAKDLCDQMQARPREIGK